MIFDSCIIIDISKENTDALDFYKNTVDRKISAVSMTEVLYGVRNNREQELFDAFFADWEIIPVDKEVARLAAEYFRKYRPSHGIDIIDAMIAATAKIHHQELATLNLKHFPMFADLQKPY